MKALRLLIPATMAVALVPFAAAPALAAPPGNDVPAGAVAVERKRGGRRPVVVAE